MLEEQDRVRAFGVLPLVPLEAGKDDQIVLKDVLDAVQLISSLPHLCGVIIGTRGCQTSFLHIHSPRAEETPY